MRLLLFDLSSFREVDSDNRGGEFVHTGRSQVAVTLRYIARSAALRKLNVSLTFYLYKIVHSSPMDDIEDHFVPDWQVEGTLAAAERAAIIAALSYCGNSRRQAAIRLRCGRSSLYRKMAEYKICVPLRFVPSAPRPEQLGQSSVVVLDAGQYILIRKRELA